MRGKYWPTPQARGADGLVRGTLRGNKGPSSFRGSLVAVSIMHTVYSLNFLLLFARNWFNVESNVGINNGIFNTFISVEYKD